MPGDVVQNLAVVIPSYKREQVLLDTITHLLNLPQRPAEILILDQTRAHEHNTAHTLEQLECCGQIRWIRLPRPSIPHAMNVGLQEARCPVVLFLDDDIVPGQDLISAHALAHERHNIVAGQVLQPGEQPLSPAGPDDFRFCSTMPCMTFELMGGNFSIKRLLAISIGGFDENFVHVAYRFEREFAERALAAGESIWFEPAASIRHLKASTGGTRSFGHHLTTFRPSHSVGEYYFLLSSSTVRHRLLNILARPVRAIRTRHHLSHPWWVIPTLLAETVGCLWALILATRGRQLLITSNRSGEFE